MGKKLALVGGLLVVALMVGPTVGHAGEASPWTAEAGWSAKAVGKLGFGVKNLLLGWTELFTEPKEASSESRSVLGGLGTGLVNAVADTLGGALHLVTFPITGLDVPLPEGGVEFFS